MGACYRTFRAIRIPIRGATRSARRWRWSENRRIRWSRSFIMTIVGTPPADSSTPSAVVGEFKGECYVCQGTLAVGNRAVRVRRLAGAAGAVAADLGRGIQSVADRQQQPVEKRH